jgi:serum/glucocorticoid-regulated kinase 2
MEFLHQNNILYRDLKPENILVDESGHLKLTDFGLCKAAFSRSDLATSFVGSPEYMSPEILLGHPYNFSVDFYTLGVLLYEMIVGLPPFYNEDKMKMYRDISYAPLSIPSILKGSIRDLLSGLLQKDPRYRLGCKRGISEIKEHSFFSDIDWNALSRKQTPIAGSRPPIDVNIFESNFDTEYTSMPIEIKPLDEEVITVQDPIQTVAPFRRRCNSFSYSLKLVQRSLKPSGADLHKYSSRKMEKVDRTPMKVMQQLDF